MKKIFLYLLIINIIFSCKKFDDQNLSFNQYFTPCLDNTDCLSSSPQEKNKMKDWSNSDDLATSKIKIKTILTKKEFTLIEENDSHLIFKKDGTFLSEPLMFAINLSHEGIIHYKIYSKGGIFGQSPKTTLLDAQFQYYQNDL